MEFILIFFAIIQYGREIILSPRAFFTFTCQLHDFTRFWLRQFLSLITANLPNNVNEIGPLFESLDFS